MPELMNNTSKFSPKTLCCNSPSGNNKSQNSPTVIDSIPIMSVNVWQVINDTFLDTLRTMSNDYRILEWGSGGSTLAIIRSGFEAGRKFSMVSIEHDEKWYNSMIETVIQTVKERMPEAELSTTPLTKTFTLPPPKDLLHKVRILENDANFIYAVTDNPHIKKSRGYASATSGHTCFLCWSLMKMYLRARFTVLLPLLVEAIIHRYLKGWRPQRSGCVTTIRGEKFEFFLFFVPAEAPLLRPTCTYDGLLIEFYRYVTLPLPHNQYDIILVDGRSRASCLKRIFFEKILAKGGTLFCHDAYRHAYWDAFQLFQNPIFIHGNGRRLDGERVLHREDYPIYTQGTEGSAFTQVIANELFVYHS
jgi:hypothetical protein